MIEGAPAFTTYGFVVAERLYKLTGLGRSDETETQSVEMSGYSLLPLYLLFL
jgi:hypothetical protein